MFAHFHPDAPGRDADHHLHWAWLLALAVAILGIALASSMEQGASRTNQVDRGD